MSLLQALLLGLIQGITEFVPVSSSGHLVIVPQLIDITVQSLVFDLILHVGTVFALLVYFWKDVFSITLSLFKDLISRGVKFSQYSKMGKLGLYVAVSFIPAAVFGFFLDSLIESTFRSVFSVAVILLIGTVFMLLADLRYKEGQNKDFSLVPCLTIGFAQVLALFPGFSRSGATISAGILLGLSRVQAARFSFLMSIPVILGAAAYKLISLPSYSEVLTLPTFAGFASSFVVGILAIQFMLKYLGKRSLRLFIIYRFLLFIFLFFYFLLFIQVP
ncbi:MAG: undecaprenyl-diphosphate phosphatase [Patescibacteria group bacterium]